MLRHFHLFLVTNFTRRHRIRLGTWGRDCELKKLGNPLVKDITKGSPSVLLMNAVFRGTYDPSIYNRLSSSQPSEPFKEPS